MMEGGRSGGNIEYQISGKVKFKGVGRVPSRPPQVRRAPYYGKV